METASPPHWEGFFALASEMMCLLTWDEQFDQVNPAFEKVLGFSLSHFDQTRFDQHVHPEDQVMVREMLNALKETPRPLSFACRFLCADQNYKWLMWRFYPQEQHLIYAIAKDVTPFQQLEESENARHHFAEALLDTMLAINSSLSLEEVFKRILLNIGKVVDHDHVNIMLIEDGFAYIADYQNAPDIQTNEQTVRSIRMEISQYNYLLEMIQHNQPVIVHDIETDPNWERIEEFHISGCYLASPITVENQVIGFLNLIKRQKNFYTLLNARQLLAFANQVGIAIKNANLYTQAQYAAALEERQRLARELHDSVSQSLYAAHSLATLIPKAMEKKPEKTLEYAAKISQRISGALNQMRVILIELYPDAIVQTELGTLLKQLCAAFTESTNLPVQLTTSSKILLKPAAQMAYYRIAQEALHNIEKHAQATQVEMSLAQTEEKIILHIMDNGIGFKLDNIPQAHFGVKNLYQRAQTIGAVLEIKSEPGQGTDILLEGNLLWVTPSA